MLGRKKVNFTYGEKAAFFKGVNGQSDRFDEAEKRSYNKGFYLRHKPEYLAAEVYQAKVVEKHGKSKVLHGKKFYITDKYGRVMGENGKPIPSPYSYYCRMNKDDNLKKRIMKYINVPKNKAKKTYRTFDDNHSFDADEFFNAAVKRGFRKLG